MRDVQITGLTPGCQDLSLTLDGHTISPRGISGLTVEAGASEVPRLTLDVLALDITEVGGQMEVLIPEEARELLMTLGWTPPAGEAELAGESVPAGNASGQEPEVISRERRVARKLRERDHANRVSKQLHGIESIIGEIRTLSEEWQEERVHISEDGLEFVTFLGRNPHQSSGQFEAHLLVLLKEYGFNAEVVPVEYGAELSDQEVSEMHPFTVLLSSGEQ